LIPVSKLNSDFKINVSRFDIQTSSERSLEEEKKDRIDFNGSQLESMPFSSSNGYMQQLHSSTRILKYNSLAHENQAARGKNLPRSYTMNHDKLQKGPKRWTLLRNVLKSIKFLKHSHVKSIDNPDEIINEIESRRVGLSQF